MFCLKTSDLELFKKLLIRDSLGPKKTPLTYKKFVIVSKRSKKSNIERLKTMRSVWRETKRDNIVVLAIFNKLEGGMTRMTIKNKQTILPLRLGFCHLIEMLDPFESKLMTGPSFIAGRDNHSWIHLEINPRFLNDFAFKNDKRGQEMAIHPNGFDDSDPFAISRLTRDCLAFSARNDDLDLFTNALHKAFLVHVIGVFIEDAVLFFGVLVKLEPFLDDLRVFSILSLLIPVTRPFRANLFMSFDETQIPVVSKGPMIPFFAKKRSCKALKPLDRHRPTPTIQSMNSVNDALLFVDRKPLLRLLTSYC